MKGSLAVCLAVLLAACSGGGDAPAPAPVSVNTVIVKAEDLQNVIELPGRVEPVRTAEVRARVTGIVQQRLYTEGEFVAAGQPLFRIDPRELRASYEQSEASLRRARATAANADAVVDRYRPLVEENAISKQEYDAAVAAARQARASVSEISAQLDAASLQLGYTTVRAPISGRSGRAQVTEGALVSQAEGTLLTRIEQTRSVYVRFNQSATEMLDLLQRARQGEIELDDNDLVPVRLILADGRDYAVPGYIDFLAYSVDEATGTVEVRAEFPNPNGILLPGEFVRAKIYAGKIAKGIAVPQSAVSVAQNGGTVFVVDSDGNAAIRPVDLGVMTEGKWVIRSGLKEGDQVIVSNLQKLRPGMPVKPANISTGRNAKPAATSKPGSKQPDGAQQGGAK
ncbi:efflux RND transporter periplasmic adaptor subunit [Croceicoccus bisphenolivorans]|uniref:efflux RND transporter periplasmic adaptor subunit n=1 Tax=Croceicoccus bisphenolivorans TaxID=1783232 RepID=UPI00082D2C92|nr:efflux RND transporter periplasmic adaptor subunit [Croceicoccus bisphenolivorans]